MALHLQAQTFRIPLGILARRSVVALRAGVVTFVIGEEGILQMIETPFDQEAARGVRAVIVL
jgi:hypothetical protein